MLEIRWLTEHSKEWCEGFRDYVDVEGDEKLQYRTKQFEFVGGKTEQVWSDWKDVPSVHIDI